MGEKAADAILKVSILVVDDLHMTIKRCEQLKNGLDPEVFIPGESFLNTLINPTTVYEKPDEKALK